MIRRLVLVLLTLSLIVPALAQAQIFVPGYWRQDGTYVQPHWRTPADGNPYNNYSAPPVPSDPYIYGMPGRGVTPPNPNACANGFRAGQEMRLRQQEIQLRQMQIALLQRQLRGGR